MTKLVKTKYKKIFIWYFSGTGNARFAANKIAEDAREAGYKASVYNIADKQHDFSQIQDNCLIGFCFPTHGFNAPPIVLKFIRKFPQGKADVFLLNTRAGMKLFRIHTPGIGGLALWLPALMLLIKGYRPIGFRPIDLPSNWIFLHPGLYHNAKQFIQERCNATLTDFTNKILKGKPVLNGFFWFPLDIILIPISLGYYLFGRFALSKTFFASYKCTNCGLCVKNCPVNAIKYVNNRPYWTFNCESCLRCINHCPERAIETAHGYSFLIWWLAFSFVPMIVLKGLLKYQVISTEFYHEHYSLLFNTAVFIFGFILFYFGYLILHQLLRIRILNKLITFTSLTHFKFWKRYRNINQ
jgi:ferredoxin